MQTLNKSGAYYDYFPPFAGDSLDFFLNSYNWEAIHDAWWDVHAAYSEYLDKSISVDGVQESDVKRWEEVYNTYRRLVSENLYDEYKQDFIDGKIV
jgi:hypothetical protein